MKKLHRIFGGMPMSWGRVLLLAVLTGALTALFLIIPALQDTSFQDPGTYLDVWVLFAVLIVSNCKTWWEASLKCFVFFLVSQPLIYLLQVPFSPMGWGLFQYYPRWFLATLLTLPGAAAAYLVKRKDWLSVAVLSVATGYLSYQAVYYLRSLLRHFPCHLLSLLFCLGLAVCFVFSLLEQRKHRLTALGWIAVTLVGAALLQFR